MGIYTQDNKRIVVNTIMLYIRMFVIMAVSLYASRVILQTLGASDYGLYNVIAGFVSLFTFVNSTLTAGTQRFLSYSLGKADKAYTEGVFNTAFIVHLLFALFFFVMIVPIGYWYISEHLNVPLGRECAAMWVFLFAVLSTMVNVMQVPFNAAITSHEKFSIYAYMSLYDAAMKLLIVYLLQLSSFDNLVFYAILYFVVTLSTAFIYVIYCRCNIAECRMILRHGFDKKIFKEIGAFAGWNTIGSLASLSSGQGVNLVINYFLGTLINAARGISVQVTGIINQFVTNFMTAVNPQIIKLYADKNIDEMYKLGLNASKFGALLMICICIPFIIEMDYILYLWLGVVPEHTGIFTTLSLLQAIVTAVYTPIVTMLHATGRMKYPNIFCGFMLLLIVPVTYILLWANINVDYVIALNITPWVFALFISLCFLHKYTRVDISRYFSEVILKIIIISAINVPIPLFISCNLSVSFIRLICVTLVSVVITLLLTYFIGIDRKLQTKIKDIIINRIKS